MPGTNSKQELEKFLKRIEQDEKKWYKRTTNLSMISWYVLQGITIGAGFATSVITSLTEKLADAKTWLVILPLIGSFTASMLVRFNIHDVWQLREKGLADINDLLEEGRCALGANYSDEEYNSLHHKFRKRIKKIEDEQRKGFFGFSSQGTPVEKTDREVTTEEEKSKKLIHFQ